MLCQEPVLHDLWCHHSWLWLSLGLERRVYTLLTPGLWLLQISTSGGPDLTLRQLGPVTVRVTPPGTLDIIKRTIGVCGKMFFIQLFVWCDRRRPVVCGDTRLSQAAVAGQASLRGCQSHRSRSAGPSETRGECQSQSQYQLEIQDGCSLWPGDQGGQWPVTSRRDQWG